MDHTEAVQQMAAERYLLEELTPEERDRFEEHAFDCPECALDLCAGAAFVDEAKVQLPELAAGLPAASAGTGKPRRRWRSWFSDWSPLMHPAFAAPVFAALLLVVSYQNLVTLPALRATADEPHLLPAVPVHGATRGGERMTITTDRSRGIALPFDLYQQPDGASYASYSFELYDPDGKLAWTGSIAAATSRGAERRILLAIPGAMLHNGAYTVSVAGIGPDGTRSEVERYGFDLHLTD